MSYESKFMYIIFLKMLLGPNFLGGSLLVLTHP